MRLALLGIVCLAGCTIHSHEPTPQPTTVVVPTTPPAGTTVVPTPPPGGTTVIRSP
jgi:hypothetical protein